MNTKSISCKTKFFLVLAIIISLQACGSSDGLSESEKKTLNHLSPSDKDIIWGQNHKKSDGSPDYGHDWSGKQR